MRRHAQGRLKVALYSSSEEPMFGMAALKQLFLPDSSSSHFVELDVAVSLTLGRVSWLDEMCAPLLLRKPCGPDGTPWHNYRGCHGIASALALCPALCG